MNDQQQQPPFNPNLHLMQIKNRNGSQDYLPVQWRLDIALCSPLLASRSQAAQHILHLSGDPYAKKYVQRFIERIHETENGCWLWQLTLNNKGYARMGMYRKLVLMHRWAYLLCFGAVPEGMELDHTCRTPSCVNPDHLEPVTHRENNLRGNSPSSLHARKTHCPEGHPLNEANTYINTRKKSRECRICKTKRTIASNRKMNALRKAGGYAS